MINITFAKYVRDLLNHPEALIKLGRVNFERKQFEMDYIAIDSLTAEIPLSIGEKYADDVMTYSSFTKKAFIVDFYGLNAYENVKKFKHLLRSQKSAELQDTYKIAVFGLSAITDVKELAGQQYGNRIQCELMVQFSENI
jgi:hypothetical protein